MHERAPWLDYLVRHIGLKEIPGPKHNARIVEWGRDAGISWWNNDEDAWCAVAVNGALVNTGYPSTRSALARSFTRYGTRLSAPVRGAIVVFPRGKNPLYGHVGIVEEVGGDGTVTVVNGNVSDRVKRSVFRIASIVPDGIRWPPGAPRLPAKPAKDDAEWGARVLRKGQRGSDVAALQRDLNVLRYGLDPDGIFGARTANAVQRFQARRGMDATGEADAATLAALTAAVSARREREDKREAGKRAGGPMAGAGAVVAAGAAAASAGAPLSAGNGASLSAVVIVGALIVFAAVAVGLVLWRFGLRRAEGRDGEDRV